MGAMAVRLGRVPSSVTLEKAVATVAMAAMEGIRLVATNLSGGYVSLFAGACW